jgi:hypothetical protein
MTDFVSVAVVNYTSFQRRFGTLTKYSFSEKLFSVDNNFVFFDSILSFPESSISAIFRYFVNQKYDSVMLKIADYDSFNTVY